MVTTTLIKIRSPFDKCSETYGILIKVDEILIKIGVGYFNLYEKKSRFGSIPFDKCI